MYPPGGRSPDTVRTVPRKETGLLNFNRLIFMNTKNIFRQAFIPLAVFLGSMAVTACEETITGEPVDEGAYDAVTQLSGMLLDADTHRSEAVVNLYELQSEVEISFHLSPTPKKGVDVQIGIDPEYLEIYNREHDTAFELYPEKLFRIENDGTMLLAPDDTRRTLGMTLSASEELDEDKTYVLPLCARSLTEGVTLTEKTGHAVYLVRMPFKEGLFINCDKGPDAVKSVVYFEVNDVNPLNALEFVLKDSGKLFFDQVVLFAANINYDAAKGRVYVNNNPNVQFLLDNNELFLQPLRKCGMKVILAVLGNHDQAGVGQLSDIGARQFAQELKNVVTTYNLDGVGFDDEYSKTPDVSNPLFVRPSKAAAARLLYETKRLMPDKIVTVYYLGQIDSRLPSVDGFLPGVFVDYAVNDYKFGAAAPMAGMTLKNCAGQSIELNLGDGNSSEEMARRQKESGYGYYMFFALNPTKYGGQVDRCQSVARGLYDEELLAPTHYYPKNATTRLPRK